MARPPLFFLSFQRVLLLSARWPFTPGSRPKDKRTFWPRKTSNSRRRHHKSHRPRPTIITPYVQSKRNAINKWAKVLDEHDPLAAHPDYQVQQCKNMEVDAATTAAAEVPVPPTSPESRSHTSPVGRAPSHPIPFPDHDPSISNDTSSGLPPPAQAASLKQPLPTQVSSQQQRYSSHSLHDAMSRLHQMEQHMHHTFH